MAGIARGNPALGADVSGVSECLRGHLRGKGEPRGGGKGGDGLLLVGNRCLMAHRSPLDFDG